MTIRQLAIIAPNIPWLEFINRLLNKDLIQVHDSEDIIVLVPSYLEGLNNLLAVTPARVLANYLLWGVAMESMSLLNKEPQEIRQQYLKKTSGVAKPSPRFEMCVKDVSDYLSNAVGSMYVKKYFDEESKKSASEMVVDIKKQYDTIIDEADWMDDVTKERAKEKARDMYAHIGYPSELLDMKELENRY